MGTDALKQTTCDTLSAAQRVFEITELLEDILLHLPIRQLLLAQKISRKTRDLIQTSPLIRIALWFEPVLPTKEVIFVTGFKTFTSLKYSGALPHKICINPLLGRIFNIPNRPNEFYRRAPLLRLNKCIKLLVCEDSRPQSWQNMLAVQPHPLPLRLRLSCIGPYIPQSLDIEPRVTTLSLGVGCTMNDIVESMENGKKELDKRLGKRMSNKLTYDLMCEFEVGLDQVDWEQEENVSGWHVLAKRL